MRASVWLLALFVIVALLAWPRAMYACPLRADAIASSGPEENDDPLREARGYNRSIYLMVGMPYLLLGAVGFWIYRGLKQRALIEQQAAPPLAGEGDRSCSTPVIDDVS